MPIHHSSKDLISLETQYYEMKKSLYRKFIKYLTIIVVSIGLFEAVRALLECSIAKAIKLPLPLLFTFFSSRYLKHSNHKFEILCVFFTFLWNASSLWNNVNNIEGFINNPLDAYYYGCVSILLERLCVEKIPNGKHKLCFSIIITITRFIIIRPNSIGVFLRHISMSAISIFLDLDKEKLIKNMFFSYNNYKKQLAKFKDLVVQDIPESIAILSNTLAKSLFFNESFKLQSGSQEMLRVREFLDKLILQNNDEGNAGRSQTISLLGFLERQFSSHSEIPKEETEQRKFTFNVVYKKSPNNRFSLSEPTSHNPTEERLFEVKTFALTWDGEPAIAIIMHDITQQQTILGLQMADAQKDMVLATVSHELRTPINGMMGIIQIMQKSEHDKRTLENLEICKNSGDLLMGLVNSILDLNLIRSNKIRMNPHNISLYDLLKDIVHMFEFQCQQKGIYIKLEISKTCPEYIFTDRNRLSQIFINLVGNALKFTFEGGITISAHEGENATVKFFIKDTGIGIKDTEKLRLFHMFGRIENDRAQANQNGVGFGLTISNGLIKLLNGDANSSNKQYIKAQSVYGAGSSFEFSIKKSLENDVGIENIGEISREFGSLEEIGYHIDKIERHPTIPVNNFSVLKLPHVPSSIGFTENSLRRSPIKKASSFNPVTTRNKRSTILGSDSGSGYVLLVDDNPFNLVVAEKLISSHGYKVKTALSGQLALKSVLANTGTFEAIKLVFMDIQMPVMDGYETTRELKSLMQKGKIEEIPIVALTANDSIADKEKCLKAGMSDHLSKPLKDQDLKAILNRYL